ncbi:amino acid ABC transporter permease [Chelatococcus asaccharovorans]|uniref:Amino acid ABC transporter membrane protein 1 (PAAT family) n=1 Tax=Chelatococcus asaccharovorans TaxID=28210 RepID=A0A2V3UH63_9HYPH|nr:amino acid ABC transporter permease [Chelatococcus asaccharovorans]MBS7707383.1 amino acid ABC transporter permease [Chelatococcus asaccharovorans]PXW63565.1 amino acid ABC transporter membrane protein 1 (PAAT family) [Chelatococcus asaccharovorans]
MDYLDFSGVLARGDLLAKGLLLTAQISLASMVIGLVIGVLSACLTLSGNRLLRIVVLAYIEAIRNTPFIVQVFLIYFGLPALGLRLDPITAAITAMSVYGGAYISEIVRAGIEGINTGQIEAARALGLSGYRTFRHVVLKPALAAVFPSLSAQFILLLLSSSVVSAISVPELTGVGNDIQGMTLRNMEIYLVIAVIYVALVAVLRGLMLGIERWAFSYKFIGR